MSRDTRVCRGCGHPFVSHSSYDHLGRFVSLGGGVCAIEPCTCGGGHEFGEPTPS